MTLRTWVIIGATSAIAEQFAHLAAQHQCALRLIGRDLEQLKIIKQDIVLRYHVPCDYIPIDFSMLLGQFAMAKTKQEGVSTVTAFQRRANDAMTPLDSVFNQLPGEIDLFLAQSAFTTNEELNTLSITDLITINVLSTSILIDAYLKRPQKQHHLLYLSSVAAGRGRAKNSLYGGSKAAIEVYLEGLQQQSPSTCHITIARLGFIDTKQTYGQPGIFYAAPPKQCAETCWTALEKHKPSFYYPLFWHFIIMVIKNVPFFIYKKLKNL